MAARLWIDVEDLFEYSRTSYRRPSGIQRLAFEIYQELQARYGSTGLVYFVRHSLTGSGFQVVPWSEVATLFSDLAHRDIAPASRPVRGPILWHLPGRQFVRKLIDRSLPSLRPYVIDALQMQIRSLYAWGRLVVALARCAARIPLTLSQYLRAWSASRDSSSRAVSPGSFKDLAVAGDVLVMLGAMWSHADYEGLLRKQCKGNGLRFALLVYDLIPLRHPEWCDHLRVDAFRNWVNSMLPLCDVVFAISRAAAADAQAYAREQRISMPGTVITLPIGTKSWPRSEGRGSNLPAPGTYALIVSTIEARKNHLLLFRVWRRMLEEMPRERVPTLVFAGRVGWLVDDLMQQIANSDNLDGKLVLIEEPSDAELAALYDGCLFTLFPSFFEGWGLPVTESLAFGKPCIISNRTSLPEAGGRLARSFDPDNLNDAYELIRAVIEDPDDLARWEAQVRREFKPVPWSSTVDALLAGLGHTIATPAKPAATPMARTTSGSTHARTIAMYETEVNEVS